MAFFFFGVMATVQIQGATVPSILDDNRLLPASCVYAPYILARYLHKGNSLAL